jgi:hypothetical protein
MGSGGGWQSLRPVRRDANGLLTRCAGGRRGAVVCGRVLVEMRPIYSNFNSSMNLQPMLR